MSFYALDDYPSFECNLVSWARTTPMRRGLWAIIALISYGSLYPFEFRFPPSPTVGWGAFLDNRELWTSTGDVLGNLFLFVPLGAMSAWVFKAKNRILATFLWTLALAFGLAFALQALQLFLPSRFPSISDVFWNVLGAMLGSAAVAARHPPRPNQVRALSADELWVATLVLAWLTMEAAPFVPSLDWSGIKDNLRPLLTHPSVDPIRLLSNATAVLLLGHLLDGRSSRLSSITLLIAMLGFVHLLRPFVATYPISLTTVLGHGIGLAAWLSAKQCRPPTRSILIVFALLAAYTAEGLAPLSIQDVRGEFHWIPFEAALHGSMMTNLRALAESVFVFGGMLFLVRQEHGSTTAAAVAVCAWSAMIEFIQLWLPGRTADGTDPLLVLALAFAMRPRVPRAAKPMQGFER